MNSCRECKHYKKDERIGIIVCEFGLHESYCEKDKEDFAIDEIEKIKAEIIKKYWGCDICKYNGHFNIRGDISDILQIIDNHISELKGGEE